MFKFVFLKPKGTLLRGTTSFDVLSVNIRAGVSAVGDWKNPQKSVVNMRTRECKPGGYFSNPGLRVWRASNPGTRVPGFDVSL